MKERGMSEISTMQLKEPDRISMFILSVLLKKIVETMKLMNRFNIRLPKIIH